VGAFPMRTVAAEAATVDHSDRRYWFGTGGFYRVSVYITVIIIKTII
jgi:hypothetical protein